MSTVRKKVKYPDTLFGSLKHNSHRLKYHSLRILGIHHWDRVHTAYNDKLANLTFEASSHSRQTVCSLHIVYTLDDWATRQEVAFEKAGLQWDTITWGWVQTWQVLVQSKKGALMRYYVRATLPDGSNVYADNQKKSEDTATQFARWLNPGNIAPAWSKTARVYQVFVDRFNPGLEYNWLQTDDLVKPFGGTLRGVIEKLNYIHGLGFNTIWLTPIFSSTSHHGYDIKDYTKIESRFGSEADLVELIELAHQKGIRVLLDFVANHSSDQHAAFQAGLSDRAQGQAGWFTWTKWPKNYASFFNVRTMPEFNLRFGSPARAHLIESAQKWLLLGIDGYRLDYAIGPGRDFWVDFQRACLEINPDCWTFGEVVTPASQQAQFSGSMHGTLDFLTCQAIRETFATRTWDAARLASYLQTSQNAFPVNFCRPAFIDNHDMNRFIFTAEENLEALHAALTLLYLLPQPLIVYYGTEIPLSQHHSIHDPGSVGFDESRLAMDWDSPNQSETARLIQQLSEFREQNPWITTATWQVISTSTDGQQAELSLSSHSKKLTVSITTSEEILSVNFRQ